MPHDDTTLDELITAAAPVADHDLDRPDVRASARMLIEELSMTAPISTHPDAAGASPALRATEPESEPETVITLASAATVPPRRRRRALAAAAVAIAVGLGSAAYVARAGSGDAPVEEAGVAGPAGPAVLDGAPVDPVTPGAPDTPAVAGQEVDRPATTCEWAAAWFVADDNDDEDGRNEAVAGLTEMAARASVSGDEENALRIDAMASPMSTGDRDAAEQASAHLGC